MTAWWTSIGDVVFVIFNAPVDLADHADKAVHAALEIDRFCQEFHEAQVRAGIPFGITRIGVHTGTAVIGNFGSMARFTYTAQGDAVNTASRLEALNKHFGTRISVSEATVALCKTVRFRPIASVVLKGKKPRRCLLAARRRGTRRRLSRALRHCLRAAPASGA